jgi:hypothetical protein
LTINDIGIADTTIDTWVKWLTWSNFAVVSGGSNRTNTGATVFIDGAIVLAVQVTFSWSFILAENADVSIGTSTREVNPAVG